MIRTLSSSLFTCWNLKEARTVFALSQRCFHSSRFLHTKGSADYPKASPLMSPSLGHLKIQGTVNYYKSIHIDLGSQEGEEFKVIQNARDGEELVDVFKQCLTEYTKNNLQGVWLKIPKEIAWSIQSAVDAGFEFHHAQKSHVMMTKWLNTSRPDCHPVYAHHFLGVGGMVVNEKDEILTIREKYVGDLDNEYSKYWKLPGGHVDPQEDFGTAVEREVLEETGIRANFKGILAFRHMHQFRYGCSDIYICCLLTTDNSFEQTIQMSEYEVHECKWVPISEYASLNLSDLNALFFKQFLQYRETGVFVKFETVQNIRRKQNDYVYFCDPGKQS